MITKKCSGCGKEEEVFFVKRYFYSTRCFKDIFKNKYNRYWCGKKCYDCFMNKRRKRLKTTSRLDSKKPLMKKYVDAERVASDRFKEMGFKVTHGTGAGPDLFCEMGSHMWTVEVKLVTKKNSFRKAKNPRENRRGSWRVSEVRPGREIDDLVAMVFPNNKVYLERMSVHQKYCTKDGSRLVSKLVQDLCFDVE